MNQLALRVLIKTVFLSAVLLGLTLAAGAQVNHYYVAPGGSGSTCSQSNPCSISQADSVVSLGSGSGSSNYGCGATYWPGTQNVGACIHLAPGTYSGSFNTSHSGTANQKIVWISDVQYGASIQGGSGAVWVTGGSYVAVVGIDMQSSNGGTYGLQLCTNASPCHDRLIYGNQVHDLRGSCANSPGGAGIVGYNADNVDIIANRVYNIDITSGGGRWCHGIYLGGTTGTASGHIYNNQLFNNTSGYGVDLRQNTSSSSAWFAISNNTIVGNGSDPGGSTACGLSCGGGITIDPSSGSNVYNITVDNNVVYNNAGTGRSIGGTASITNSRISNNIVYGNSVNTITQVGSGTTVAGTINSNPQLVSSNDFHLTSSSPAIGAGNTGCASASGGCTPNLDFAALSRPSPPSIGAFEFGGPSSGAPAPPTGLTASVQ